MHLLVHPVHHIQPGVQRQLREIIEPKLALFRALLVAVDAVISQDLLRHRVDAEFRGLGGERQGCR